MILRARGAGAVPHHSAAAGWRHTSARKPHAWQFPWLSMAIGCAHSAAGATVRGL